MPLKHIVRRVWIAVLLAAATARGRPCGGAELMSAAHASIRAAEAGGHVDALADDAFEGREGGSRGGRAAAAYVVEHLTAAGLEPAGDDGSFYQAFGSRRNVLAILPGGDPTVAHELVVVGAHYDHVGYGNAANSFGPFGFVHNGADDNASGVAGLLEVAAAARLLATPPRRPILFAFWDGEEQGLLGSRHFLRVRPAAVAGRRIVFSVNLDMIGRLRDRRLEVYGTRTAAGLRGAVVAANNDPANHAGLELAFDWDIEEDSDHYPFIRAGIPTVMFHTGLHDQYHRPADDAHLVDRDGIECVARLTLGFVRALADAPGPVSGFRSACLTESNATRRALEATPTDSVAAPRGRWGIGTRDDPGDPTAPVVVRVTAGTPAAAAGLVPGDRILAIDGVAVENQATMLDRLKAAGGEVALAIDRRGRFMAAVMRSP
jgi:hypothetical protein